MSLSDLRSCVNGFGCADMCRDKVPFNILDKSDIRYTCRDFHLTLNSVMCSSAEGRDWGAC